MSIALSLFVKSENQTLEAVRSHAGFVQWIELRLDQAPPMDFCELVRQMPKPTIATCPLQSEGGFYSGSVQERNVRLLQAASGGARFVDVALAAKPPENLPAKTRIVHSWHEKPGEQADLRVQLHHLEGRLNPGDVAKVVAWAEDHSQAMRVASLYGTTRAPLVAFAQGPGGKASRAWAPTWGAPWTYASPIRTEAGQTTGVGQWKASELFTLFPPGGVRPTTSLYGVVGNPVTESRSPLLWNTAFRILGLDAFYVALPTDSFAGFLHAHRQTAVQGFSVTAPFKKAALESAQEVDPAARAIGAANTLQRVRTGWKAYNTDGDAALEAMAACGCPFPGEVLVLGAGGAARAAVYAALQRGCSVQVAARRLSAAQSLCEQLQAYVQGGAMISARTIQEVQPQQFTAVVNATPVGSLHEPGNVLAGRLLPTGTYVLDMVYQPYPTALGSQVREQGAAWIPGHHMLLRQMLAQFRLFTGQDAPWDALLRALETDLKGTD